MGSERTNKRKHEKNLETKTPPREEKCVHEKLSILKQNREKTSQQKVNSTKVLHVQSYRKPHHKESGEVLI